MIGLLNKKHFHSDIEWWRNLTENKLVIQVIHRTLACGIGSLFFYQIYQLAKLNLTSRARFSLFLFAAIVATQLYIGMK